MQQHTVGQLIQYSIRGASGSSHQSRIVDVMEARGRQYIRVAGDGQAWFLPPHDVQVIAEETHES